MSPVAARVTVRVGLGGAVVASTNEVGKEPATTGAKEIVTVRTAWGLSVAGNAGED